MKPRTCRCDCLQMHPNQLYESVRVAAFLPGADGNCAEGGRGSSERSFIASGATPVSSGPVPKIRLNLGISKQTLARYISQLPNSHQRPVDSVHSDVKSL